ncbi:sulfite exporter TauE/SafE family protein [Paenalcaligenes niemegkensis]|uniref:sulfite exporter TauE/SafE family protein n=1 Tax=Paenalcaligenes niemegkensis TaxID=2895469 RepID=UPI001EE87C27|nr:sulfite exporter TauE/SafE family protein [Paenalcaligenes niemegkensis]MCQ9615777.1 sulfite exporter TauE/SafE family protein [Paenalcaligenes niemegkensis]
MNDLFSLNVLIIALTFFVAGIVKGVTGMGLPTLSMGVLSAIMSPLTAASLLIIPSFVTNFWQLITGPDFYGLIKRLWLMMLAIVVGTIAGTWLLRNANTKLTHMALGAALVLYVAHGFLARPLSVPPRLERGLSPAIGIITGAVSGATGVFVIPAVPYLQALGLNKDDLIQALGLSFTVSTIALAVGLGMGGALHPGNITLSALAIIPAFLGMWVGTAVRARISVATFRRWFMIFLGVLGVELIVRSVF